MKHRGESFSNIGDKIKAIRTELGLTQKDLSDGIITRNMLSSIESGNANPSLDTLKYIADRLSVSVAYLLSDEDDLLFFEKKDRLSRIYRAYDAKRYKAVIELITSLPGLDDELYLLLASAHLEYSKELVMNGALVSAAKNLEAAA